MFDDELDALVAARDRLEPPICSVCGVTALPATQSNDPDPDWVCDHSDCVLYGEVVG